MINLEANCYARSMSLHLHLSNKNIRRAHVSFDAYHGSRKATVPHGPCSLRTARRFLISNDETDILKNTALHCVPPGLKDLEKKKEKLHSFALLFFICFY